jgi:hypothetical protein
MFSCFDDHDQDEFILQWMPTVNAQLDDDAEDYVS